jgi:hypothetical protein
VYDEAASIHDQDTFWMGSKHMTSFSLSRQLSLLLMFVVCISTTVTAITTYLLLKSSLEAQIDARLELGSEHTETLMASP